MKGFLKFLFMGALIAGVGIYIFNNYTLVPKNKNGNGTAVDNEPGVDQKMLTFSIDGRSTKGVRQWHLEGRTAEIMGEAINLDTLEAVAYGDKFSVNIESDSGVYRKDKSEVELIGHVKVTSEDGGILMTDRAVWSHATKDITTETLVSIERKELVAVGKGGMANSEKKIAKLLKDVTVKLEPSTLIHCDGPLDIDLNTFVAVFYNNVKVKDKDGKLTADKLIVTIDQAKRKISEVIAEGNVKLYKGNSYTICEKVRYTDGTKSVEFLGRPKIVIAPDAFEKDGFLSDSSGFMLPGSQAAKKDTVKKPEKPRPKLTLKSL
ncbi:MAG: LPS export ABC transporter periplasmic protein LptC [Candidatus Omnitrophica bacterium]|nr:LPS export ABC transporter periplasmic protein LptC [Candidatus Omnitrophota bacterium]